MKRRLFLTQLFLNAFRFGVLLLIALIVTVIGFLWIDVCQWIGLGLLVVYILIVLITTIRTQRLIAKLSDDSEFGNLLERISENPHSFLSGAMEDFDEKMQLHGDQLSVLSDDDLFETVYYQNLDIAEKAENEDLELAQFSGPRRTVYILSVFDMEIQNGGLCQFFVNSSGAVAPYVCQALAAVGAAEHRALFEQFLTSNSIDISDLASFRVSSTKGYIKQTKRFDYDAFDDRYYDLPALQDYVIAYIRNNIKDF